MGGYRTFLIFAIHLALLIAFTSSQNCDFERGTCSYIQSTNDTFDWSRQRGSTSSSGTGPSSDHTSSTSTFKIYTTGGNAGGAACVFPFLYNGVNRTSCTRAGSLRYWCATTNNYPSDQKWGYCAPAGWYMFIESSSPRIDGDTAVLFTPILPAGSKCLTFFYHMYGPHISSLSVYVTSDNSTLGTALWAKSGTQGNVWQNHTMTVSSSSPFQVGFEGKRGSDYQGDIAIDDISFKDGACNPVSSDMCTFETDTCGYMHDATGRFNWTRHQGQTGSSGTGPSSDHTKGTAAGYYMYVEASSPRKNGDKARMYKSYTGLASGGSCLVFWYHMFGADIGRLNIYVNSQGKNTSWNMIGQQGNQWAKGQITIPGTSGNVVFEGVIGNSYQGDIAVDDISVMNGKCANPGECDFETNLCTWYNTLVGDNFDWIVGSGSTPSYFTGPTADRNGNRTAKFLFIESSSPRVVGDTAHLVSTVFNRTAGSGRCFTFWYHMYGTDIGRLNIYVNTSSGGKQLKWRLIGNQGNSWFNGQVNVGIASGPYSVILEGVRGNGYTGDIAIDDFSFRDGACSVVPAAADPSSVITTVPPTTTPTVTPSTGNTGYDCNFESGLCSPYWNQDTNDTLNWTLRRGSTPSVSTGPSVDHTLGTANGYYIYLEVSNVRPNNFARLISGQIPATSASNGKCLRFWYHMYGAHVNRLNVYVKVGSHLGSPVWTKNGTHGDQWNLAAVTVRSPYFFKVIFEALAGSSYQGDIALDDISLKDGPCPQVSSTCTFEDGSICGYTHEETSAVKFKWARGSGQTSSVGTGPGFDHTLGTSSGFYMYTEASSPRQRGDKARLISPTSPQTTGSCLQFWYHMYGSDIGTLNVFVRTGNTLPSRPLWSEYGDKGNAWKVARKTIASTQPYEVVFEGIIGNGYQGDIAVDDVKLTAGACPSPGSCTFENGNLCTYSNANSDNFDWITRKGRTGSSGTGPAVDHTTGTSNGTYLYIEASSPRQPGHKARLVSEQFNNLATTTRCLTFWYHMYGADIGKLNVIYKVPTGANTETLIWNLTGQQQTSETEAWRYASVPVASNTDHTIVFEGIVGSSYMGDIAIDDIQITTQRCTIQPPNANPNGPATPGPSTAFPNTIPTTIPTGPFNCNFETGLCQYVEDSTSHFNWTRVQGYTHSAGTGPSFDHTRGKGAVGPRGPGSLVQVGGKCLHVLNGAWTKPANDQPLVTYDGCGQQRLEFLLTPTGLLKHTLYGQCVRPKGGAVADGTEIGISDSCGADTWRITAQGSLQHIQSGKCVMAKGGYSNPPNNNKLVLMTFCGQFRQKFSWLPTLGWYAFIESSAPRQPNDTARLMSSNLITTKGQCLNFWYHMYGAHVNQLNVYLETNTANLSRPVWSKFGTHGDVWKAAHVSMNQNPPFKIVFEAVRGNGYQGDIAIDDVSVTPTCPAPLECTFEETNPPLCGWMNVRGRDRIDWSRATGRTASDGTGPASDHTYGNDKGYYMFIETSGWIPTGANAYLMSPQYDPASRTGGKCLQFWYHMYGNSIGTLNVYLKTGSSYPGSSMWTRRRNQGNQWLIGQVSITTTSSFNIIFEGVRGTSYTGDIAIDDIKMLDGACNQPASCDFENDRCTWTNTAQEDDFDWIISKGSTPSGTTGPSADHTKRNGDGTYAYIESSAPRKQGDKARFISERFPLTTANRCLRFWYHMFGASIGTLNVLMKYKAGNLTTSEKVIWSLSGNKQQTWRYGAVPIQSTQDFQMVFEGIRGNGYAGDIAIDDISYTVGSCSIMPANAVPMPPTTSPPTTSRPPTPRPSVYSCDFQKDFCSWTRDATANFNWTRHIRSTSSSDTGPSTDHTMKNSSGYYIYIETSSPRRPNDTARLLSPTIPPDGRMGHCVKFWFHMYGPHVNALNVYKKVGNVLQLAWKRVGNNGNIWRYGQVTLNSNVQYQVVFEGVRGTSFSGDIALDDLDVSPGVCPTPTECDWEHGLCGFTQDSTDDFDWTRQKGSTPSIGTGPSVDHTLQTNQGYYIYTEMSGLRRPGDKARMVSPVVSTNDAFCLEFWYHMQGIHVGTLNVYRQSTGVGSVRSIVWSQSGNHGGTWKIARVTVSAGAGRQVTFEGVRGSGFSGDIAIDDIKMIPGNCPPPGHCDFETGTCTWVNAQTGDDFDWLRGTQGTPSAFTGPSVDHTTGTAAGYYMFIETSSPRKVGDVAYLMSEMFLPTSLRGRCIKFWYHMMGGNIGTLNVNLMTQNGTKIPVWSLTGQQGNNWMYGQAPIRSNVDYQMIFEGVRGNGFQGDIALDDIEFTNFACGNLPANSVPVAPTTKAPSTPASTRPPTPAPSPWNCNFTKDKCSWADDPTGHFNWTRHQGSTGSGLTGPQNDHTTGTASGWYIFIETSYPRVPNDTARLVSQRVPSTNRKCLQFWYHMYGDHVDNLTIYMKTGSSMTKLWQKRGTQGNRWRHGLLNIVSSQMFQIVFEATRGASYRGDIALDDISLNDGSCPPQAECTFEDTNLCGWTNVHGDNFDWSRASGSTASVGTGPSADHTYGTSQGYYVYIEASAPRSKGHKAWLRSPVFTPSTGRCLQFWYHMYGYNVGTLNVLTYSNGSRSTPLYSLSGSQGNIWRIAQVTIASTVNHQMIFEASVGTSYSGDIAIDDVLIKDGACPLPGNCAFETGMCTYMNVKTGDEFDWLIGSGGTTSQFTGPSVDHTTGTKSGRFLFIETSWPRLPKETARVESEVIMGSSTGTCLRFWYHMQGAHIGTFNVYLKIIGISTSILWSLSDAQGSSWLQGQIPVKSGRRNFQIVFEGIRGSDYQGDIALDDISMQAIQGTCPLQPTQATPWGCNFEQDTCNWRQTTDDSFDWRRYRGRTSSTGTGPNYDHTLGNWYGYYMYIETSAPRRPNDTARLISPVVRGNGTVLTQCVSFYYHMYGPHVNTLSVYTRSNGRYDAPLWVRNGTQGPNWRYGEVQVKTGDSFQIVFEGKRGLDFKGDIAIDDIDMKYGDCISSGICTFEAANICGWVNSKTDASDWKRASGSTASVGTGPRNDHTYGTGFGHYLYLETSTTLPAGSKAIINTPYYYNNGQKCVQFYYHMYGNTVGQLNVYVKYSFFSNQLLFSKSGNQNDTWRLAQVQVTRRTYYRMVFEAVKGSSFTGDIAIDDFKIRDGACPNPGDCDFEDGDTCSWTNSQADDFDWIVGRGGTPSFLTGPRIDHTTGTGAGYYAFIESSAPRRTGDKAVLTSMEFPATTGGGRCISFWYHMYGSSIGTLNIFQKTLVGTTVTGTRLLWQLKGNQGNTWLQGRIPLTFNTNYQIMIEAIRGTSFSGDIAVDDIEFTQGSCAFTPYAALPPGVSTPAPTPSVTPSRGPTAGNTGFDCNFELGWCTYTTNSSARFRFLKHKGNTASAGTGPHYDHTYGNGTGTYVYAEASSPAQPNDTTQLTSAEIPAFSAPGKCLSFWYHMYGPHVGSLRVLTKIGAVSFLKWQRTGTQGDEWRRGLVQLPTTTAKSRIVFEAIRGVSYSGDIAIDDISVMSGTCPPPDECDFEYSVGGNIYCQWTQDKTTDNFDWTRANGQTASFGTGPATDHTLQTSQGYYMYIETSSPRRQGDKARFLSPVRSPTTGSCLAFWYHMYGTTIGSLSLYSRVNSADNLLWSESGNQGNIWRMAMKTLTSSSNYQLMFEGTVGSSYTGDIAIDDLKIVSGACPRPGHCDFEAFKTCTYLQDQSEDNFDWIRGHGATSSWRTGPSIDNTKKDASGHYMYIEASAPRKQGDKARLVSEFFPPTGTFGRCVKFAFHMFGTSMGTLNVYVKTGAGNQSETLIWSTSGNHGNVWIPTAQAPIVSSQSYAVVFEGIVGSSYSGDIAIDDISYTNSRCSHIPASSAPPTVAPTTTVPSDSNCTFETGLCNWRQLTTDNFDWKRNKDNTGSVGTGPVGDHTTGKGHYIYIETSSPRIANDTAVIESPPIKPSRSIVCLQFWYHMHGAHVNQLNVYKQSGSRFVRIWARKGTQGNKWRSAQVNVYSSSVTRLRFEGVRGTSYQGDIAVDDVVVLDSYCPRAMYCDFEDTTLCGWSNRRGDQFDWTRGNQGTPSLGTGPSTDHTTGTSQGNYVYIETSYPRRRGDKAWLYSPVYPASVKGRCLNFWYHMYGADIGSLNIYLTTPTGTPLWNRTGNQNNVWRHGRVTLQSNSSYTVVIEGIVGKSYRGDIALDDIYISEMPCPPPGSCDFEYGSFCTWNNVANGNQTGQDDFDWERNSGSTSSYGTGPTVDHTVGTALGTYIFIETSGFNRRAGEKARLESELFSTSNGKCLSFWYHMYGQTIGTFNIYLKNSNGETLLKTYNGSQGNIWKEGEVGLYSRSNFRVILEATRGTDYRGDISLDDLYVKDGNCVGLCTSVVPMARVRCGGYSVSAGTCRVTLGCCYDDTVQNVPNCFYHPATCSAVPVAARTQCGTASISRSACQNMGCCYDASSISGVSCYHTLSKPTPFPSVIPPITTPAPSPYDCNFDGGLCQFVNTKDDNFDWTRDRGGTPSALTGPSADHTQGNANGYYMYIETSWQSHNDTANLKSPKIDFKTNGNAQGTVCVRFWYHMYGSHVDALNVFIQNDTSMPAKPVWTRKGTQGDKWRLGQIVVKRTPAFNVIFQGTSGPSYQGDIALDDVSFVNGNCLPTDECEFESPDICGYTQDLSDDFDWTRATANTSSSRTGPPADHTYGTAFGHYMHIEASYPRVPGDRAVMESPAYPATIGGKCVEFYYHMYGADMGTLRMFLRKGGRIDRTPVWTLSGDQGNVWHRGSFTVQTDQIWQIVFEGIRGGGYTSDAAIDDVKIHKGPCPSKGSCDFEIGYCGYTNIDDDKFDWIRHSGDTPSVKTGPKVDHTLGTSLGQYVYIEASSPRVEGDYAHLASELFKVNPQFNWCVTFYYHMYGQSVGTLIVESLYRPSWGRGRSYYRTHKVLQGNQGDRWNWMQVDVTQSYDFQIVFEGKIGKSYDGDISLDDISVTPGKCPVPTPSPSPNPCAVRCKTSNRCIPATKICDFVNDCGATDDTDERNCGACDFESGLCQWNDSSIGVFDWKRGNGATATANTGPSTDHTKGDSSGYYAYVEASVGSMYSLATLQSPSLKQASATCQMNFWYHMYGTGIGDLRVYIEIGTSLTLLWHRSGNQGDQWTQGTVYIMRRTVPYKIKIEAERSYSTRGDIAVDDITFQGCSLPTAASSCYYRFRCAKTQACVPYSRQCDYTDDCGDGTDEINCQYPQISLSCNFEYSLCYWRQLTDDQFNWTRSYGSTDSSGTGPLFDHTSGTNYGKYLYAEASYPRIKGDKARIVSRNVMPSSASGTSCMIRFYYHMNGDHIGRLSVKTRQCEAAGCPETLVWTRNVSTGDVWIRHASVLRSSQAFQVIIEAERGSGYMGDIAIDDVSFYGCIPSFRPLPTPAPSTTPKPTTTPCASNQFYCPGDATCIEAKKRCDYNADCKDGSDEANCGNCNFEKDSCGYKDSSTGKVMWGRASPALSPVVDPTGQGRGPQTDNTKKTDQGYLMRTIEGSGTLNRYAVLRSPMLSKTGPNCALEFYYYMNETQYSWLSVYGIANSIQSRLFSTTSRTNGQWKRHLLWLGSRPSGWQLAFTYYRPFFAIDDIRFVNCSLAPDRGGQCKKEEFACTNGACIAGNRICDFQDDCGDGSDEGTRLCSGYKERCNFETGGCNWLQVQGDNFDWSRRRGSTGSTGTGPGTDHTRGDVLGYYLYIETSSPRVENDTALLMSAPFKPVTGSNDCSQGDFWYRDEINLSFMTRNFRVVFEGKRGGGFQGDIAIDDVSFTPGCNVDFSVTLPPNIVTASPPPGCQSGEFRCKSGQCISAKLFCDFKNDCSDGSDEATCTSSCDFEKSTCNWVNTRMGDQMDWFRLRGRTGANGTWPLADHTTNTTSGYFMTLGRALVGGAFPNAHLVSPLYLRGSRNCKYNFWYNMGHWSNYDNIAFRVLYRRGGRDTVLWSTSSKTDNKWKAASVPLPNCPTDFQIVLEAHRFWQRSNYVAVDDIGFQCTDPAPPSSCSASQFKCTVTNQCVDRNTLCDNDRNCCDGSDETDSLCSSYKRTSFETGLDIWTQLQSDDFDWTLTSGHTGSFDTGPSRDHTLQEEHGKYIFMEASSPRKTNDTTRLASPTIKGSGTRARRATGDCRMRFFYHMSGAHIGQLNIYTATTYGQPGNKVWSMSGDKGSQWLRGEVQVSNSANFQVIIEGIVGTGFAGDISLDDISFTPGCNFNGARLPGQPTPPPVDPCYPNFYCVKDRKCISRRFVCDFTPDCTGATDEAPDMCGYPCSFQNGWCGYKNQLTDDYDWQRHSGGTASAGTGPSTDATGNKTGMYAYVEASQRRYNKRAVLLSPTYGGAFADCTMVFYYHMYGANVGSLWLLLSDVTGHTAMWRYAGASKNQWMRAEVSIGRRLHPFNMSFYSLMGNGWQGDIAIDEINFANCTRPGACKNPIGKFACRNGACIDEDKVCDLTDDCGDGSDEDRAGICQGYIGCTFESIQDSCNWTQATDDDFDWTRDRGGTPTVNSGPTRDHTYGTSTGYYMYMETSGRRQNQKARLVSILFNALKGGSCKMRMFYHMFGTHTKDLNVYVQLNGSQSYTTVYTATGNLGDKWRKAVIDLSKQYSPFRVVIEGVRGVSYQGDIAVDDISFTPDCITNGSGNTGKQTGKSGTKTGVTAAIVVGCLVVVLIIILVAYIVMKRKREKKLHLFSVFYDPSKQDVQSGTQGKKDSKKKQKQEEDTGLSNPVYDEKPFEDLGAEIDMGMFGEDSFTVPTDNQAGATSMANPLYQDPYYEEDGPMSEC
eukprot:gene12712-3431_t